MKIEKKNRIFKVGKKRNISLKHVANIILSNNEQITFLINKNKEYDIVKKNWGFYATPSINGRLIYNNYKTVLVKNRDLKLYILIVQKNKMKIFNKYLRENDLKIILWLNNYLLKK
jgi:hypothetical protein